MVDIPTRDITLRMFGEASSANYRQVQRWLGGHKPLPVDVFWQLYKLFPFVDIARSLQDLYDRRLASVGRLALFQNRSGEVYKNLTEDSYSVMWADNPEDDDEFRETPDSE